MNPGTSTYGNYQQTENTTGEVYEPLPVAARFEAGQGEKTRATHGSIEEILETAGFKKNEIRAIYFGNWLRDYSQLLDPKIVRATTMPKRFPDLLSREALTRIVDVLAVKEFTDLMQLDRSSFTVTPQRLGVYRPGEHIDNPRAITPEPANPKERDADFEDWVKPDDPALQVDFQTSMKRYIQRSVETMSSELDRATQAGPQSFDGLRALGSGLHILEDFFSHSNFVELSLIKLGHTNVLPWTSEADCRHRLPLVTGMFGGSDIIASLAAPLGKILFSTENKPFEAIRAGERYERDQIIQILLSEHPNDQLLQSYETFLTTRDQWANLPFSEQVERFYAFIGAPGRIVSNAIGTAMQGLATWLGNSIDDFQTILGDDPNTSGSTDPSHSQLAKDHAEHPLHSLAALLAEKAVLQVGQTILGQWSNKDAAEHPAQVAAKFFVHPMDSDWQDELVRDWANRNPGRVKHATLKSDLDRTQEQLRISTEKALLTFNKESSSFLQTFYESHSLSDLWNKITGK